MARTGVTAFPPSGLGDGNNSTRLLAADLDGTFLGDDRAMHELWEDLDAFGITLVFASGRHLPAIESLYDEWRTDRRADVCLCMVGTEVWWLEDGEYRFDDEWDAHLDDGWDRAAIGAALVGLPRLQPQPDEWQSQHKLSFFVPSHVEAAEVEQALTDDGHHVKVVWSSDCYLDILPHDAGKGGALTYVVGRLGIDPQHVAAAGDTGNDLDMMRAELGFNAIVVANATQELRAMGGSHVYRAAAPHAAGIREGLAALGWLA
ncbi:MAG TPA: HAD-IIB family hydrolase [Acidimicrobiia bacterium]